MKKLGIILLCGALAWFAVGCGKEETQPQEVSVETQESSEEVSQPAQEVSEESEEPVSEEEVKELPEVYLREVFAEHNMKVGTCLTTRMISDPTLSKLIKEQFNSVTMENDMKPENIFNKEKSIEAGDLVVELNKNAIKMLDWAKENNMAVRGHTLVWYSQTPDWIFYKDFDTKSELVSRKVMLARLESYIRQVFATLEELGYSDLFYAYDVANEAWMENGTMRENLWSKTIGDDYLWQAFYLADKYAPENIDLYYNDYNEQFKTDTLLNFVKTLVDKKGNYLIDGIGFQAHLYTRDNLEQYFRTVDALSDLGLKIELTELDVSLGAWQSTLRPTDDNLKTQGKYYYNLINGLFERVDAGTLDMDALTFWGFADNLSWRKGANPLLYNMNYEPKYAYYGAAQIKEYAGF